MRVSVWSLAVVLMACGNAERNPRVDPSGGSAGAGLTGGAGASGGASAAGATSLAGSSVGGSAAGTPSLAGSSPGGASAGGSSAGGASAGGSAAAASGAAGERGEGAAGSGAEAGAGPTCEDTFVACGCGCCGDTTPTKRCYYPDVPGHLESLKADDARLRSMGCDNVGCSMGVDYVCCPRDAAADEGATYEVEVMSTALDRLTISRTGSNGLCARILFEAPNMMRNAFLIETPQHWAAVNAAQGGCMQSSVRAAIGGVGRLDLHGSPCVADFDFTLFFPRGEEEPEAIVFRAQGVPLGDASLVNCD